MKLLSFILLFVSCSCFALSSEEFDKQYQNLNGELNKAVINNMIYSKDYDDKKIPLSEKIESKSKWCDLTKTRINLLDFVIIIVLIFYILTIYGIFILRKKIPDAERPYKAFGYPFLPMVYIILASAISVALLSTSSTIQ